MYIHRHNVQETPNRQYRGIWLVLRDSLTDYTFATERTLTELVDSASKTVDNFDINQITNYQDYE